MRYRDDATGMDFDSDQDGAEFEPCSVCQELHWAEAMADCADLGAFVGPACADCEDELISAGHFETCICANCRRRAEAADRERLS